MSTESSENSKISAIPRGENIKFFPQGTYMGQNFIPKALTILDPKTEGIPKIYQLEKEPNGSLNSFKALKFNHAFIHIHSFSDERKCEKNVPLIVCNFHTK